MTELSNVLVNLRHAFDRLLKEVLDGCAEVAMLDYPDHDNIGDSAIWLGEVQALQRIGVSVVYSASHLDFDPAQVEQLPRQVPILIHGGGNLGDLWRDHQQLRERIIQSFRSRKIIQLPQSIHFESRSNAHLMATACSQHPDLTLLVRDLASERAAGELLSVDAMLCPDAALAIDMDCETKRHESSHDVIALLRRDAESARLNTERLPSDLTAVDWHDDPRRRERQFRRICHRAAMRSTRGRHVGRRVVHASHNAMAAREVKRGIRILSSGETIITDRLHALVLATMIGRPSIAVENSYGKLRAVHSTWLTESSLTQFAPNVTSALAMAEAMRTQGRSD